MGFLRSIRDESQQHHDRRTFLGGAIATGVGALAAGCGSSSTISTAASTQAMAEPRRRGSLDEVEHVVILMQENRSFDHYYGTMRGVRGFGDRAALRLPAGLDVFHQPDPKRTDGGFLLPFHVDTSKVDGQDLGDLDHSWGPTHTGLGRRRWDGWVANKSEMTMGYFTEPTSRSSARSRTRSPSVTSTSARSRARRHPTGSSTGPARSTRPATRAVRPSSTRTTTTRSTRGRRTRSGCRRPGSPGRSTPTRRSATAAADGWVGDFGDNPLWLFQAYHDSLNSTDPADQQLATRANVIKQWLPNSGLGMNAGHVLADFVAAAKAGTLPKVSWVVAPYRWCEHPAARPVDGAAYVQTRAESVVGQPEAVGNHRRCSSTTTRTTASSTTSCRRPRRTGTAGDAV